MGTRDVYQNFDWREYVETHYAYKEAREELRVNCPSCGDDDFKCYVNPTKGVFHCFKCPFSSRRNDLFDFVAKTEGISRSVAMMRLVNEHTPTMPTDIMGALSSLFYESKVEMPSHDVRVIKGLPASVRRLEDPESPYATYLFSRGLTWAEIQAMQTHFCDDKESALYHRVVWPVYGAAKDLVSWASRTIDTTYKGSMKYFNCPDSDISKTLWPFVAPRGTLVVVCEGLLDCMAVRRLGFDAYCAFGKKLSLAQRSLLLHWGVTELVLLWDPDAKKDMKQASKEHRSFFKRVYVPNYAYWLDHVSKNDDAGDALHNDKVATTLADMLQTHLIDVDTPEFVQVLL